MALTKSILGASVVLSLALFATVAQASALEQGNAAFNAGRFDEALRLWSNEAKRGNPQADFDIGLLYDLGDGVPESASLAFHWYRLAADFGLILGQFNVGVMYDSGRGTPRDMVKAATWYARAAARGHARAAFNLGLLYDDGDGVPENPEIARAWYAVAAKDIPFAAAKATAPASFPLAKATEPLAAPSLVWPRDGISIPLPTFHPTSELVWTAQSSDFPMHFFVELRAREKGVYKEIYASYVDTSAVAVTLNNDQVYAWRVYAVADDGSAYASSPWSRFEGSDVDPSGLPSRN